MVERRIFWETSEICRHCGINLKILITTDRLMDPLETMKVFLTCSICGWITKAKKLQDYLHTGRSIVLSSAAKASAGSTTEDDDALLEPHEPPDPDAPNDAEGESCGCSCDACSGEKETSGTEIPSDLIVQAVVATLNCTKPFNLTTFIGQGWNVWKGPATGDGLFGEEEIDPRSLTLTTLDPAKLLFETCLKDKETSIKGEEKLKRLKEKVNFIRLGGNVFLALWEDYLSAQAGQKNKENSVLEWLYCTKRVTLLDFFGLILRGPGGNRCVLCLCRSDVGRWYWDDSWLDYDCNARSLSAVLASLPAESSVKAG